jgi:DNA-binding CsgD family transcriptional regulator
MSAARSGGAEDKSHGGDQHESESDFLHDRTFLSGLRRTPASPAGPLATIRHSSYLWKTVSVLASRDAERLFRFVGEAERLGDDQPFTPELLVGLGELVDAECVSYCELDRVRRRMQPHLARLWRAARTRRLLASAMSALGQADEHDTRGVIFLGIAGEIEFASPPSLRLLREYFPPAPADRAPLLVVDWLASGAQRPLVRRLDGRRLTIQRSDAALLLEERREEVRLTAREREVLSWVARGKTNVQIAELLWLSPSTVRKHLENVYAKLNVSSRTAAVTRFLGLLDEHEERTPA